MELRLDVRNQRGVLASIAANIAEQDANIGTVSTIEREGMMSTLNIIVEVRDRKHLADVMRTLRTVDEVARIYRVRD